ncbi:hypothetical protein RJT34_07672 [Clitoria ternatea]|uniref:FAE domain-containing protein n=1 Tax=Clitoria ternatea TaxID=43366 RepID=A0AAN9PSC2_CLITE
MLFTNKPGLRNRAILKLKQMQRIQYGADDEAYNCCIQMEDEQGYGGFGLTKNLVKAAGKALTMNLQAMAPKILPLWELVRFFVVTVRSSMKKRKLLPLFTAVILGNGKSYPVKTVRNPFKEQYDWLNDECLSFVRLDFSKMAL